MTDEEERILKMNFDASKCVNLAVYKEFCSGCRNCMPRLYHNLSNLIPDGVTLMKMIKFEKDVNEPTTERSGIQATTKNKRTRGTKPQTRRRKQEAKETGREDST